MGAIFVLLIILASVNFVIDEVVRTTGDLNCDSASTISDGTKFMCLVVDSTVPYWVYLAIAVPILIIIGRSAIR